VREGTRIVSAYETPTGRVWIITERATSEDSARDAPAARRATMREEVEMAEKVRTEIDAELLEAVRRLARQQGRDESAVIEDAIRRYVSASSGRPGTLAELFERIDRGRKERGVEPLSEEEAMRLANEELHAMRREQTAERRAGR
jgi:predicted transcriptional regulator